MHPLYDEFIAYLDKEDKEKCVNFVLFSLEKGRIDIVTLYNEVLTPALYAEFRTDKTGSICIWEEHVRTSIVRTIIECCYPYVIKERNEKYRSQPRGKAVIVCPPEELHEIGARMVADFFTLCGFDSIFIGANTPPDDIVDAVKYVNPHYVAISVTNYYNLVAASNIVRKIREIPGPVSFKVILGGQACRSNPDTCRQIGADMLLQSFADIRRLGGQPDASL